MYLIPGNYHRHWIRFSLNNAQGEYYLPDTLTILKDKGLRVDAFALESPEDINGVNDQKQLESAAEIIRRRKKECTL